MPTIEAKKDSTDLSALLKAAARSAYTLAREHVPLRSLLERPEFSGLSYRQLYAWYAEEDWAQERRMNLTAWAQSAQAQRGTSDRLRHRHMTSLHHLYKEAERLRSHHTVRPKSWEALAQFQLKAVELFRQWEHEDQDRLSAKDGGGQAQPFGGGQHPGQPLSDQEEWMVAQMLLKGRLEDEGPSTVVTEETSDSEDLQRPQAVARIG